MLSSPIKSDQKQAKGGWTGSSRFFILVLEREPVLSSFPANPTFGSLRDKRENCSTRSGLRVDTGFEKF